MVIINRVIMKIQLFSGQEIFKSSNFAELYEG